MNKYLICLAFAAIVALTGVVSAGTYSGGGNGTAEQPYRISTPADMNNIGANTEDWGSHFVMVNDINLAEYTGTEFNITGYYISYYDKKPFTGVFDGNGHTISNFTYTTTDTDGIGLFGCVYDANALIKDLTLVAPDVNAAGESDYIGCLVGRLYGTISGCGVEGDSVIGYSCTGGLVGYNSGTISNCYAEGSVAGIEYIGGLVGCNFGTISTCHAEGSVSGRYTTGGLVGNNWGTISNCYAEGSVTGHYRTGGLVGDDIRGRISNCYATGSVSGTNETGGLAGYNVKGTIENCYATGSVVGTGTDKTGGLVGGNSGTISNCYAEGSVTGTSITGGLAGYNYGTISSCYSSASVMGISNTGGLTGYNHGLISSCYAAGSVSGLPLFIGGLVGRSYEGTTLTSFWDIETTGQSQSAGGEGKTTAEMKSMSTFFGWGCTAPVWTIDEGQDYPRLAWEGKPGEPIAPTLADFLEGAGTQEQPFLISTAEKLNVIGLFTYEFDKYFKVTADIDLSGYTGTQFNIIGNEITPFAGIFDGNAHTISNFTYTATDTDYVGLFGYIDDVNAMIKDLHLADGNVVAANGEYVGCLIGWLQSGAIVGGGIESGSVSGHSCTGGLVGANWSGTISNCYASASVSGENYYTGVLVGVNYEGTISNCHAAGAVDGNGFAGGLVGENIEGTITNCYATGSVMGDFRTGGLVGYIRYGRVSNCYAAGVVKGTGSHTGGLVGSNFSGKVENCYAVGSVSGTNYTGGLVGSHWGKISNCYATGSVLGTWYTGGLVGDNDGVVTGSFWDIEIGGPDNGIGTGLPTSQMQIMSTFTDAGWDFTTPIWKICEDNDYPRLWWEECPEPVEAELWIFPRVIVRHSRGKNILAWIRLPEGVTKEQISDEPILLWPGEIEAVNQYVIEHGRRGHKRTSVLAFFGKAELMDAVVDNGEVEVEAVGSLKSGRYFYGSDTVLIKGRR